MKGILPPFAAILLIFYGNTSEYLPENLSYVILQV